MLMYIIKQQAAEAATQAAADAETKISELESEVVRIQAEAEEAAEAATQAAADAEIKISELESEVASGSQQSIQAICLPKHADTLRNSSNLQKAKRMKIGSTSTV